MNSRDITARYAQRAGGFQIERLSQFSTDDQSWQETLVENRQAGPADTAAARIDVAAWLGILGSKRRQIAEALAQGERTVAVAETFGLSPGRVSQLRRELAHSWEHLQGLQPG